MTFLAFLCEKKSYNPVICLILFRQWILNQVQNDNQDLRIRINELRFSKILRFAKNDDTMDSEPSSE
ncbi:MAG: hypothetical protein M1419_00040 [Bacteroidetes bacterium]|nr:hypothetical protein [Bacteroidota bacterium]